MLEAFVEKNKEKMRDCLRGDLEGAAKIIIPSLHSAEKAKSTSKEQDFNLRFKPSIINNISIRKS
jgi:hypothetical protein